MRVRWEAGGIDSHAEIMFFGGGCGFGGCGATAVT